MNPADELQIWGSGQLLQTLLRHALVDRSRLMTFPVVLGAGRRLFNDGILPVTMRPVDITVTGVGIVLGTYEPAGPARSRSDVARWRGSLPSRTPAVRGHPSVLSTRPK